MAKQDMSSTCGLNYFEYWNRANHEHTMPQEEFQAWFKEHCAKCYYMCEICMFGEGEPYDA